MMIIVALLIALQTVSLTNPALTPGAVRPLTKDQICHTRWGLDHRSVTEKMRRQVMQSYGIPWSDHGRFELDHLIPRALGGRDSVENLWPQCCIEHGKIVGPAHEKDVQELRVQKWVCSGQMSLEAAQALFPNTYGPGAVQ